MDKPFQRKGVASNSSVGKAFELKAQLFFASINLNLHPGLSIPIGINGTKLHSFDLGDSTAKVLVECKSHKWTEGRNVPSAKMTEWNEAMYYFYAAPGEFRKILFVLKDYSQKRKETLAQYYIRTYPHLIPKNTEIWEFDENKNEAARLI